MAQEQNINLTDRTKSLFRSSEKSLLRPTEDKWFSKPVETSGVSEFTRTERLLGFTNCLMEFCFEESLFKTINTKQYTSLGESREHPASLRELQEEASSKAAFEQVAKETVLTPEESLLHELWQKGYLQCDRIH